MNLHKSPVTGYRSRVTGRHLQANSYKLPAKRGGPAGQVLLDTRAEARRCLRGGGMLLMTLVFVSMFLVIFMALSGLVNRTYRESVLQAQDETAFQVAEAGLNYARWRLAHDPENYNAEMRTMTDPFGGDIGTYNVTFTPPIEGGTVVTLQATGSTINQPGRDVVLTARYGRPSLAQFASVTNDDVWYGGAISGPVHANGGIRMDGDSDSIMTSSKDTYACQPHHVCASPFETKPGIWGSGTTQELWEFPMPVIDYNALTLDLLEIKTAAQAAGTYYGSSGDQGYQIEFHSDNTYSISTVTSRTSWIWSWYNDTDWQFTSHDVGSTSLIETRAVPSGGVIYTEDRTWVRGDIRDRVTVAAGVFPDTPATNVDIILNGDVSYGGVTDGTRALAAIAQRHILIPYSGAPDIMDLDGAFVAQKGSFHRRYYDSGVDNLKSQLTRYGMIASNGVPTTAWVSGSPSVVTSGFQSGTATYDPNFLYAPPPYFPTSGQYTFISWEEAQ